jgi:hypothetical protein
MIHQVVAEGEWIERSDGRPSSVNAIRPALTLVWRWVGELTTCQSMALRLIPARMTVGIRTRVTVAAAAAMPAMMRKGRFMACLLGW